MVEFWFLAALLFKRREARLFTLMYSETTHLKVVAHSSLYDASV
jgi:hypothetical protein